jgi:hypothetical protein
MGRGREKGMKWFLTPFPSLGRNSDSCRENYEMLKTVCLFLGLLILTADTRLLMAQSSADSKAPVKKLNAVSDVVQYLSESPRSFGWECQYNSGALAVDPRDLEKYLGEQLQATLASIDGAERKLLSAVWLARVRPAKVFAPQLKLIAVSGKLPPVLRCEAIVSLGLVEETENDLKALLDSKDDYVRAAAIDAIGLRGNVKAVSAVWERFSSDGKDWSIVSTGAALGRAKYLLDCDRYFRENTTTKDKIAFLLRQKGFFYEVPSPGNGLPFLKYTAGAFFLMKEFRQLAKDYPEVVEAEIKLYFKDNPSAMRSLRYLVSDLGLAANPDLPK